MKSGAHALKLGAVLVLFTFVAVLLTWPLAAHPRSRLAALTGPGDPYLNLWVLAWDWHQLAHPLRLFDANIFYPSPRTLAYSDHLILQALLTWPMRILTGDPVAAYNALFFFSLVAAGFAMYLFAREVTGRAAPAVVAGLVFGFWPFHFAHLGHLQLQGMYGFPLVFLALLRFARTPTRRRAWVWGVLSAVQILSSAYYAVLLLVGLAVAVPALASSHHLWRDRAWWRGVVVAAITAAILVAPFVYPYWRVHRDEGFSRNLYEASHASAAIASYFSVPFFNWLYGRWLPLSAGQEHELFPGFVALALAGIGAVLALSRSRESSPGDSSGRPVAEPGRGRPGLVLLFVLLGAIAVVLSFGPTGWRAFYAWLFDHVIAFQAIRAPARFAVLVQLCLAALAAMGVTAIMQRLAGPRSRLALVAILIGGVLCEYANRPIPYVARPALDDPAARWLAAQPTRGPVLELPIDADLGNTPYMVNSLAHWMPLVNGYSGQRPEYYLSVVEAMRGFPSAESLWTIHEIGVRYVVVHENRMSARVALCGAPPSSLVARARFGPEQVYEVVWTPEAEAALGPPPAPIPPPPGPASFAAGERLRFNVSWSTFVTAGEVRLEVSPLEIAPRVSGYRFAVAAETAAWIKNFYEARDEFLSFADVASLLPVRTERHLREGHRRVDDGTSFDREKGVVRVKNELGFRTSPGARDPIVAFYYVRTLPLAPGQRLSVPVNDQGKNLIVDLDVQARERVRVPAGEFDAIRIVPRIRRRLDLKTPAELRVWLSDDVRHLPLRVEATAGFGRIKVELTAVGL